MVIFIIMEKMTTGGLLEKKDHVDQIQKCSTIQENQHVDQIVNQVVTVVNMLKYGIMFSWNILKTKTKIIQNYHKEMLILD